MVLGQGAWALQYGIGAGRVGPAQNIHLRAQRVHIPGALSKLSAQRSYKR